jgi:hypothetical protein
MNIQIANRELCHKSFVWFSPQKGSRQDNDRVCGVNDFKRRIRVGDIKLARVLGNNGVKIKLLRELKDLAPLGFGIESYSAENFMACRAGFFHTQRA